VTTAAPTVSRTEPDPVLIGDFHADYADAVRIHTQAHHDARTWAAQILRGAEARRGFFATFVWRGILGLRIAPIGTPGTVAGWRIASETATRVVLAAEGRPISGRMVFDTSDVAVTWTTMLVFHRSIGRQIWDLAGRAHRAIEPRCLLTAERALSTR
jgi:hypothetical protein